jgi:hypothetical protein
MTKSLHGKGRGGPLVEVVCPNPFGQVCGWSCTADATKNRVGRPIQA